MGCPFHNPDLSQTTPVMETLKSSTAALHASAEGHEFQRALVQGALPAEAFAKYLGQLLLVHRALESALRQAAPRVPAISRVVKPYQFQEPYLLEDLAFYGVDPATITPTAATAELIAQIKQTAQTNPVALLGHQYVLEGSNNGNKFIAKAIQRAYSIPDASNGTASPGGPGLRYLDPYGDNQRAYWQAFKDDMNACAFSPAEIESMTAAAQSMFQAIGRISGEMPLPTQV